MELKQNIELKAEANNIKPLLQQTQCCTLPFVQLWNEDCLETLKRIETGSIDLLLQDTPFGCTQNDWDIKPNFEIMWQEWERVTKENAAMIFFGTQPFASELILSCSKYFRYDLIWYKPLGTCFLNAKKMPMRNHEHILVFYRKLPTYNPLMRKGKMKKKGGYDAGSSNYGKYDNRVPKLSDEYYPESVLSDFSNGDRSSESEHPTQKPLDLIRYLVKTYSNENEIVFDGYSGSGTTAHACIKEKRQFIGSELSKEYFEMSVKRLTEISMKPELSFR